MRGLSARRMKARWRSPLWFNIEPPSLSSSEEDEAGSSSYTTQDSDDDESHPDVDSSTKGASIATTTANSRGKSKGRFRDNHFNETTRQEKETSLRMTARQRQSIVVERWRQLTGKTAGERPDLDVIKAGLKPIQDLVKLSCDLDTACPRKIPFYLVDHLRLDKETGILVEYRPQARRNSQFTKEHYVGRRATRSGRDETSQDRQTEGDDESSNDEKIDGNNSKKGATVDVWRRICEVEEIDFNWIDLEGPVDTTPQLPSLSNSPIVSPDSNLCDVPFYSGAGPSRETGFALSPTLQHLQIDHQLVCEGLETQLSLCNDTAMEETAELQNIPRKDNVTIDVAESRRTDDHQGSASPPNASPELATPEPISPPIAAAIIQSSSPVHIYSSQSMLIRPQTSDDEDDFIVTGVIRKTPHRPPPQVPSWYKGAAIYYESISDDEL